jgi:hypothetical protein
VQRQPLCQPADVPCSAFGYTPDRSGPLLLSVDGVKDSDIVSRGFDHIATAPLPSAATELDRLADQLG